MCNAVGDQNAEAHKTFKSQSCIVQRTRRECFPDTTNLFSDRARHTHTHRVRIDALAKGMEHGPLTEFEIQCPSVSGSHFFLELIRPTTDVVITHSISPWVCSVIFSDCTQKRREHPQARWRFGNEMRNKPLEPCWTMPLLFTWTGAHAV